jgi:hypothetical protein
MENDRSRETNDQLKTKRPNTFEIITGMEWQKIKFSVKNEKVL